MESTASLLDALCTARRICYVWTGPDWQIRSVGGALEPWPGLTVGHDLRHSLPELRVRAKDAAERVGNGRRFVLRWVERAGSDQRTRYYELNLHPCAEADGWICWLIDRSAYGRLKVRIDRYYQELVGTGGRDQPTDPFSALDPELTR